MTNQDKFAALLARCKCGVFLSVNEHRDYYETAADTIEDRRAFGHAPAMAPDVEAKMIETDTIVELQFYPNNPTSCYLIWHYSVDAALDMALEILK